MPIVAWTAHTCGILRHLTLLTGYYMFMLYETGVAYNIRLPGPTLAWFMRTHPLSGITPGDMIKYACVLLLSEIPLSHIYMFIYSSTSENHRILPMRSRSGTITRVCASRSNICQQNSVQVGSWPTTPCKDLIHMLSQSRRT